MQSLKRVLWSLRSYWLIVFGAFVSLLLLTVANAITPQLFRWAIDRGIARQDLQTVLYSASAMVVVAIGRGLFNFGQSFWAEQASQGVAYDLRNTIFKKIQNLSFSYHDQVQTSQLLTRITNDVEQIRLFIGTSLIQVVGSLVTLVTISTIVLVMNWQLALITLAMVPTAALLLARFLMKNQKVFGSVQQQLGDLNAVLQENLLGIRVVKAFVRQPTETARYIQLNDDLVKVNMQTISALRNTFPLIFLLSNLITLAVVGYGGAEVIGGSFTIGELVAFNSYLLFILQPILLVGFAAPVIAQAAASAERVYEVVDAQIEIRNRPGAVPLQNYTGPSSNAALRLRLTQEPQAVGDPPTAEDWGARSPRELVARAGFPGAKRSGVPIEVRLTHRITFENVHFRYPGATAPALKGISFETKPKELIAILGSTGSGKSTIVNLIPRFYDVTAGAVRIDGYDVRDLTLESLRSQIGIVFQETTLFSGTLRNNIAYAAPNASMEDVIAAAKTAQIHDFIVSLPEGYQTLVGERGVGLSGGQKQRIAIARTLLTNYQILILDDSTSAVDAKTAAQIQESLDNLMRYKTCTAFVIAQRISTIRNADRILLMDKGLLVAQGTHDQLMRNSPLYGSILESQVKKERGREPQ